MKTALKNIDHRILVVLSALIGVSIWVLPIPILFPFILLLYIFFQIRGGLTIDQKKSVSRYFYFILFWVSTKFIIDTLVLSSSFEIVYTGSVLLFFQLFILILLSLIINQNVSPRIIGQTMGWFVKPILGKKAWKVSLLLMIMLSMMPRIFRLSQKLNQTILIRAPHLSLFKRISLTSIAVLKITFSETESIAIAILSRDLFRSEPWEK